MTTQPEALRLAQHINDLFVSQWGMNSPMAKDSKIAQAAAELRRLHEINQELLVALKVAKTIIGHPDDSISKYIASVINKAEGEAK